MSAITFIKNNAVFFIQPPLYWELFTRSVDQVYPAFGSIDVPVLDSNEAVVQFFGDWANLGLRMEDMKFAVVEDAPDGRYDGCCAAGAGFGELVDILDVAVPLLGLHAEVFIRHVEEGVLGYRGQDGG